VEARRVEHLETFVGTGYLDVGVNYELNIILDMHYLKPTKTCWLMMAAPSAGDVCKDDFFVMFCLLVLYISVCWVDACTADVTRYTKCFFQSVSLMLPCCSVSLMLPCCSVFNLLAGAVTDDMSVKCLLGRVTLALSMLGLPPMQCNLSVLVKLQAASHFSRTDQGLKQL